MATFAIIATYLVCQDEKRQDPAYVKVIDLPTTSNIPSCPELNKELRGKYLVPDPAGATITKEVRMKDHIAAYLRLLAPAQLAEYEYASIREFAVWRNWRLRRLQNVYTDFSMEFELCNDGMTIVVSCRDPHPEREGKIMTEQLACGKALEQKAAGLMNQRFDPNSLQFYIVRITYKSGYRCYFSIQGDGHHCDKGKVKKLIELKTRNELFMDEECFLRWAAYIAPCMNVLVAFHRCKRINSVVELQATDDYKKYIEEIKEKLQKADEDFESMMEQLETELENRNPVNTILVESAILRRECEMHRVIR